MVHMLLASGLCPDWEDWDPKKAKQNAQEAMDAAEKWLDVPQVNACSYMEEYVAAQGSNFRFLTTC